MSASKGAFLVPSDLPKQFDVYPFIATERFAGKLKGKIVVVVGASTGIGKAIALAFAAAGASLALVARRKPLLDALVDEIKEKHSISAIAIQADIVDEATPQKIISHTESNLGPIDILISNAAQHKFGRFHDLEFTTFWSRMESSFKAPAAITHAIIQSMISHKTAGIIINISSTSGAHDIPFQTAYTIPKTAMLKLIQNISWELQPHNILTFSVHPGNVMTDMVTNSGEEAKSVMANLDPEAMTEKVRKMWEPYQGIEWQKPELAANTIVTLCCERDRCKVLDGRYVDCEQDLEQVLIEMKVGVNPRRKLRFV